VQGTSPALSEGMQERTLWRSDESKMYQVSKNLVWEEVSKDLLYFDFDAHATETQYPNCNIVGIRGFQLEEDGEAGHLLYASLLIELGVRSDNHLIKHNKLISKLFDTFHYGKSYKVLDFYNSSATIIANLRVLPGTMVFPVDKTDNRTFQRIGIRLATDLYS
jgi:hypothetical protein